MQLYVHILRWYLSSRRSYKSLLNRIRVICRTVKCHYLYSERNFIKKWPLHQETATSSRNGHIIKKRPLHQKTSFFDEVDVFWWIQFCWYIFNVILCRTWWSAPFFDKVGTSSRNSHFIKKRPLHQEMATSSRNGHFIKKWPLHQILADIEK